MTNFRLKSLIQMRVIFVSFLTLVFLISCQDNGTSAEDQNNDESINTPRTLVPDELVGEWYTGTISSTNFFNPATGTWGSPNGIGIFFKFSADGYFEKGVLLQSSLYGCTSTFLAYIQGTMTVENGVIVLYPTYGRIKSEDNCVTANNYEKPDPLEQEIIIWEVGQDDYGTTILLMRYQDGDPSAFYQNN